MKRSWIKLYVEIVDDPKMGRLSDGHWRIAIELFLLAGENGKDGLLPPVDDIAWKLRRSVDELADALHALSQVGIVDETSQGWNVTHFKDRQFSESFERVKRFRNAAVTESNADGNADVAENESPSSSTSTSTSISSSDSEGGGMGEGTDRIPETPRQAAEHPDIKIFQEASGRFPGSRDYAVVIDTIRFLRGQHGEKLVEYLKPYWIAWSTRKTKDGKSYQATSLVWLCEWAMNGQIPSANGSEPKLQPEDRRAAIRKVAQNAKH
jgi:hypothetical protein